jgi:hypothetical protein
MGKFIYISPIVGRKKSKVKASNSNKNFSTVRSVWVHSPFRVIAHDKTGLNFKVLACAIPSRREGVGRGLCNLHHE